MGGLVARRTRRLEVQREVRGEFVDDVLDDDRFVHGSRTASRAAGSGD